MHYKPLETDLAKTLLADLMKPRMPQFMIDFVGSAVTGWGLFALCAMSWGRYPAGLVFTVLTIAGMILFRPLMFVHQIFHLPEKMRRVMEPIYQVLAGFPLLVPMFLYEGAHWSHHRPDRFASEADPEYRALSRESRLAVLSVFFTALLGQWLVTLRFLVLGPVSFLNPQLRKVVRQRFSTLSLRPDFVRDVDFRKEWTTQELCTSAFAWALWGGWMVGAVSTIILLQWIYVGAVVTVLNAIQIYFQHRYLGRHTDPSLESMIADTNNLVGRIQFITCIWAPVGQRYHALHHWFPRLPYHSMGIAHQRLLQHLPADSTYRHSEVASYWEAFSALWRRARRSEHKRTAKT